MAMKSVTESYGLEGLYVFPITKDDDTAFTTDEGVKICEMAELSSDEATTSTTHFYNNKPRIIIETQGNNTLTITVSNVNLEDLAFITGKYYDNTKKAFSGTTGKAPYFAVQFDMLDTDNKRVRYNFLKGKFNVPNKVGATRSNDDNAQGMELTFSFVHTQHAFANGGGTGVKTTLDQYNVEVEDDGAGLGELLTPDSVEAMANTQSETENKTA